MRKDRPAGSPRQRKETGKRPDRGSVAATGPWYNERMPSFRVETPQCAYDAIVERGAVRRVAEFLPARSGKVFIVTTEDVWKYHGEELKHGISNREHEVLFLP